MPFSRTPAVTEKKILVRAINDSAIDNGHPGTEAVVKDSKIRAAAGTDGADAVLHSHRARRI